MTFAYPNNLLWLWLTVPFAVLLIFALYRRKKILRAFAAGSLWKELSGSMNRRMLNMKYILLLLVFILSIIALARPQWGFELQEVRRKGVDILLAVDVSKSMLTEDVAPNRLERTKLAVRDLVEDLQGDRVGLIAFAGDAFTVCPLTSDYGGVMLSLEGLGIQSIPRGGTHVSSAIEEAGRVYSKRDIRHKTLVILTDGDNLEGDPVSAAEKARDNGIKIYTVGIGTREGELIRVPDGRGGHEFLKDRSGNFVKSRLNESLLQELALSTGGLYVRASGARFGLDVIYEREIAKLEKTEFDTQMKRRYFERFQWPLGAAVIILILMMSLPVRRTMQRRAAGKEAVKFFSFLFFLFSFLALYMSMPRPVLAGVSTIVRQGNKFYAQQDYHQAAEKYDQALQKEPESDIINFNAGTAAYQQGAYEQAAEYFQKALLSGDEDFRKKAHYNLGNTFYRMAERAGPDNPQAAVAPLEKSLIQYKEALKIHPDDEDASFNQDFVKKVLEKVKEQIQKQKQQCQNPRNQDGEDNKEENKEDGSGQTSGRQTQDQQQKSGDQPQETPEQSQDKQEQGQGQEQNEQHRAGRESDQDQQEGQNETGDAQQQAGGKPSGGKDSEEDLSQREARMRLDDYENNQEPKGLLNLRGTFDTRPVQKDW